MIKSKSMSCLEEILIFCFLSKRFPQDKSSKQKNTTFRIYFSNNCIGLTRQYELLCRCSFTPSRLNSFFQIEVRYQRYQRTLPKYNFVSLEEIKHVSINKGRHLTSQIKGIGFFSNAFISIDKKLSSRTP